MRKIYFVLLLTASALFLGCCNKSDNGTEGSNPFDKINDSKSNVRNKIVVISDLHLGNDLTYSETVAHIERLEKFLNQVRSSSTVKELILNGDIVDEWYIPTRQDTYGGGTQADFTKKSVAANKGIFDLLNKIIKDGKVKVTYIPGNHDMGFTAENIDLALPGVNQARDAGEKFGVGTYHPDGYPQIAIEHGHRYDFFCAMTPGANESDAPGATLPPGYFFARIAANSFTNPTTKTEATKVRVVTNNTTSDPEQTSKFTYYSLWKKVIEEVIFVKDNFSEPIIKTNVGKYTKTYSVNDIIPYNRVSDGSIQMNLYNGLFTQSNWNDRLKYNNVPVMTDINSAIAGSFQTAFLDNQSDVQYFKNPQSSVRLVIFGHTHIPMIKSFTNLENKPCLYVNSGTWEDQKIRDKSEVVDQDAKKMHFVVLFPSKTDNKKLRVDLYQFRFGEHCLEASNSLEL